MMKARTPMFLMAANAIAAPNTIALTPPILSRRQPRIMLPNDSAPEAILTMLWQD